MKKLAGFLAALALLLQCGGALAQSDRKIIDTYRTRYQFLLESIKASQDLGQCDNLKGEIDRLEVEYTEHQELLAEALSPESFSTTISTLRKQLTASTERITQAEASKIDKATIATISKEAEAAGLTIKEYKALLEKLNQDVQDLNAKVQQLSAENSALLGQIQTLQVENRKDKESIAKLKELTDKLNANIKNRDELIFTMMDSFVSDYSKPGLTDAQQKNLLANAQSKDYVGKIIATVNENVKYAETTLLTPQDAEIVRHEQRNFLQKWNVIKPSLGKLYQDDSNSSRDLATVDDRLSVWKDNIDNSIWKSIHQVFIGQNVDIGPFRTAEEFQARLTAYIDGQMNNPSRDRYNTFKNKVWDSPIKDQWLPIIPNEELAGNQRTAIEERIALWDKKITALLWRWVLMGIVVIALIAVLVVLFVKKKKPMPPAEDETTGPVKFPTS